MALSAERDMASLYEELRAYPGEPLAHPAPEHRAVVAPLRVRVDGDVLAFFSIVSTD